MVYIYWTFAEVFPCEEFKGIPVEEMMQIQNSIEEEILQGGKVAIHCRMGWGRTGTVLGILLKQRFPSYIILS